MAALRVAGDILDTAVNQPGAICNRRRHHGVGERRRVDLRRGCGRAQLTVHRRPLTQPAERRQFAIRADIAPRTGHHAQGIYAPVSPIAAQFRRQPSMQFKAAPRQRRQGRAVASIQRQKPARLSRGAIGHARAFDDNSFDIALAEEIGGRGADHPAAADDNFHGVLSKLRRNQKTR